LADLSIAVRSRVSTTEPTGLSHDFHSQEADILSICAEEDCSGAEGEMGKDEGRKNNQLSWLSSMSPADSLTGFCSRCAGIRHRPI